MRLQTDPTVIMASASASTVTYAAGPAHRYAVYTYTRAGMPPSPIAMPGLGSLHATLHRRRACAVFRRKGDGSSHFSRSLEEHDRAVTKYQRTGKR